MHSYNKRGLALLLLIAMTFSILAGCSKEHSHKAGTISDFESQTHFSVDTSGDDSVSGDTSKEPLSGEFVVSEKRYRYEGMDLMVLYVENKTNRHYNVTIHGMYLDENGGTLEEESQTFEGFAAGWQNYFIFRPKNAFDRFTYTVETEEYVADALTSDQKGVPYATSIELLYNKNLYWQRGLSSDNPPKEIRELWMGYTLLNHHAETTISVEFHLLILDRDGQVFYCSKGDEYLCGTLCTPVGGEDDGRNDHAETRILQKYVGEDETIPDTVQGVFTAIFALVDVVDYRVMIDSIRS